MTDAPDDEWDGEPVGSCEGCGVNLYADDDPEYCDQCAWAMDQSVEDGSDDEEDVDDA